jgi:hypothetical protein
MLGGTNTRLGQIHDELYNLYALPNTKMFKPRRRWAGHVTGRTEEKCVQRF